MRSYLTYPCLHNIKEGKTLKRYLKKKEAGSGTLTGVLCACTSNPLMFAGADFKVAATSSEQWHFIMLVWVHPIAGQSAGPPTRHRSSTVPLQKAARAQNHVTRLCPPTVRWGKKVELYDQIFSATCSCRDPAKTFIFILVGCKFFLKKC